MKQLTTAIISLLSLTLSAQDDILLSYQIDSVYNDSAQTYEMRYILFDTTGDVQGGNYTVRVNTMDSATFINSLYQKTWSQYNKLGDLEGARVNALQAGLAYRQKATEMTGEDGYRDYVMPFVRESMAGEYILRYNGQIYRATLLENGVARDAENALIFTNVPLSSTWTVISFRVGETENVQCYKIREGIWVGDGAQGRMILRKI